MRKSVCRRDGKTRYRSHEIDAEHHGGLPPHAACVARTIFVHTLAFNDPLEGLSPEQLRYSVPCLPTDLGFIKEVQGMMSVRPRG